jgi:hypothetical protein
LNFDEFLQPAIFALTGKPGAGKSYFATRCIIAEITKGNNRTIVTNVPINRKKLREYVKKDFNLYDLETFSDNRFFFSNRGHYNITIDNASENLDFGNLLKEDDEGVLYIIDEAHLYFNARNWKHMLGATLSYITFIRHIGDTCIYMCQKFSDIDSQFRGKTQAFHLLRNLSKERWGWFKRGNGFRCYQYQDEAHIASHGSSTDKSSRDFTYSFNLDVANCYNTSLFNKAHDKKYKVRGIPVIYLVYAFGVLILLFLIWAFNGGIRQVFEFATPKMVQLENLESFERVEINEKPTLLQNPISNESLLYSEVPVYTFNNGEQKISEPYINLPKDELIQRKLYWLGESIKTKISFFSEKDDSQKNKEFGFQYNWNEFLKINQIKLSAQNGLYNINTPIFNVFSKWVNDKGFGISLKETEVILKENVPFELNHGFQIPYDTSFATQGVIKSTRGYQQVGFKLNLVYEKIDDLQLLRVDVENSDVLDISASSPILQTFSAKNVLDVQKNITYLIADFNSQTTQKQKGLLKTYNYESSINNKIFISFGNN